MSNNNQILGQSALAANTLTDVYTVPSQKKATITMVTICNRSILETTFRIAIAKNGEADSLKQYIHWDVPLPGKDTFMISFFLLINEGDVVRSSSLGSSVSINISGQEDTNV